jgi:hypothetical protein
MENIFAFSDPIRQGAPDGVLIQRFTVPNVIGRKGRNETEMFSFSDLIRQTAPNH